MYLHERSQKNIDALIASYPHATLLFGPEGVGLNETASYITDALKATVITFSPEKDGKVDYEKGSITVDAVRSMRRSAMLDSNKLQFIVIDSADKMTRSAQNALLKLLEEPREGMHLLLTTSQPSLLLPTIHSRVVSAEIRRITKAQTEALLDELNVDNPTKRAQLLFIAEGLPSEIKKLATDESYLEERSSYIRNAREFLQADTYKKFTVIEKYKENRASALLFLNDTAKLLAQNISRNDSLAKELSKVLDVIDRIEANGNVRLWLATLVV